MNNWGEVTSILKTYAVANADAGMNAARKNGLTVDQTFDLIRHWNAGGRQGGAAALYKTVCNTLPNNLPVVLADIKYSETEDSKLDREDKFRRTAQDERRAQYASERKAATGGRKSFKELIKQHGDAMAALDDCEYWALAGYGEPPKLPPRGFFTIDKMVLDALETQGANR